jgi:hypothetical protein
MSVSTESDDMGCDMSTAAVETAAYGDALRKPAMTGSFGGCLAGFPFSCRVRFVFS